MSCPYIMNNTLFDDQTTWTSWQHVLQQAGRMFYLIGQQYQRLYWLFIFAQAAASFEWGSTEVTASPATSPWPSSNPKAKTMLHLVHTQLSSIPVAPESKREWPQSSLIYLLIINRHCKKFHHRGTENTEKTRRKEIFIPIPFSVLRFPVSPRLFSFFVLQHPSIV